MREKSFKFFAIKLLVFIITISLGTCKRQPSQTESTITIDSTVEIINQKRAMQIVHDMSDSELCAQVIITGIDSSGSLQQWEAERLHTIPAGAIMLFSKNLKTDSQNIKNIKNMNDQILQVYGVVKPFIATDHEGGFVQRLPHEFPKLAAPLSYWEDAQRISTNAALDNLQKDATEHAALLSSLGITMNLAPVVEVLNDKNEFFLKSRSYGRDPFFVASASTLFVQAMFSHNIACVIKHFPGNTGDDPHFKKPVLNLDNMEIEQSLTAFKKNIATGNISAVMISHVIVNAWDPEINASLSSKVINDKLRKEFKFDGIIIADDFAMGAVGGFAVEESSLKAIIAGADMIMAWPADLLSIYKTLCNAVETKILTRERLEDASYRIIYEKLRLGIIAK
ncbi:MAG: glycoside hydrolase family 3 N-terminal domain-containing protein [Termitinemataceae bacterium]|nr:MAG: glycoside hydrolase family 3 N-terminal domain-containing protein [Termitinemataceae bacterium]